MSGALLPEYGSKRLSVCCGLCEGGLPVEKESCHLSTPFRRGGCSRAGSESTTTGRRCVPDDVLPSKEGLPRQVASVGEERGARRPLLV